MRNSWDLESQSLSEQMCGSSSMGYHTLLDRICVSWWYISACSLAITPLRELAWNKKKQTKKSIFSFLIRFTPVESLLFNQVTMVTTNSPKATQGASGMLNSITSQKVSFTCLSTSSIFLARTNINHFKHDKRVFSLISSFLLRLASKKKKKNTSQISLLNSLLLHSLTTKRKKRAACSGRFGWMRCPMWRLVLDLLSGCAPPPPGASAPAGWGSSHPSKPGSGLTPGNKQEPHSQSNETEK